MTIDYLGFFPAAGRAGRWLAIVEPIRSRQIRFHLLKRSHISEGIAVVKQEGEKRVIEAIKELEISFTLKDIPEGEFSSEATIESQWGDGELRDFLQAIVDCAHGMGIVAGKVTDRTAEITTLKQHLEDMRALAGLRDKQVGEL